MRLNGVIFLLSARLPLYPPLLLLAALAVKVLSRLVKGLMRMYIFRNLTSRLDLQKASNFDNIAPPAANILFSKLFTPDFLPPA
jgi:hypothetical protein